MERLLQHNVLMYAVRFSKGSCFTMKTSGNMQTRGNSLQIKFVTHFKMLHLVNKLKLGRIATVVCSILIKLHGERG